MEPLSAFGLAAGILQVIDFSTRLLSTGYQLYQDGSTVQNVEFTVVADDLSSLNDKIKSWARPDQSISGPLAQENQALENLAHEITKIVEELNRVLLQVRRKGEATVFKSFTHAILTIWKKPKIEETMQRLETMRSEVQFRILVSMVEKVDKNELKTDDLLKSLDDSTKTIVQAILSGKADLTAIIAAQTQESIKRERDREEIAKRRHDELMTKIDQAHSQVANSSGLDEKLPDTTQVLGRIKERLDFPQLMDRYDTIKPAHERTFDWVFQDPIKEGPKWSDLNEWLRTGGGVYWISGKAGSGKSTLMKYLIKDRRLRQALEYWAGDVPLLMTSFYFWNPGTPTQKSQEGLFRTIILDALNSEPDLGPILFPKRYETNLHWETFPTFHQLRRAFLKLTTQSTISLKIALIIDGLDEFEPIDASYTELAEVFLTPSQSGNVKALLSSRPLSAFEAAFADSPKLRLQDLTQPDIETYISDRLGRHQRIAELSLEDPTGVEDLISEIISAASGVFLWVRLTVDSLLEGFHNYDVLDDLRQRLKAIPRDLEELFMSMLNKIPHGYRRQSSQLFQIVRCYDNVLRDENSVAKEVMGILGTDNPIRVPRLTSLALAFTESTLEQALKASIHPYSDEEIKQRFKEMIGRLRSRCAGLIELRPISDEPGGEPEVQYLHRTVADWLRKDQVWDKIIDSTRGTEFNPHDSIIVSLLLQLKSSELNDQISKNDFPLVDQWLLVRALMVMVSSLKKTLGKDEPIEILDELDRVMTVHFRKARVLFQDYFHPKWENWYRTGAGSLRSHIDTFLAFAIEVDLDHYVRTKIDANGGTIPKINGRPLLHSLVGAYTGPRMGTSGKITATKASIAEYLLKHGANPNEKFDGISPWCKLLDKRSAILHWARVTELFLLHGADPHTYIEVEEKDTRPGAKPPHKRNYPYHRYRMSVLAILRERATYCFEDSETPQILLSLVEGLKDKGVKDYEYWVQNPDGTIASTDESSPGSVAEKNVAKVSKEKEGTRRHRARRYVERLFGSVSKSRET